MKPEITNLVIVGAAPLIIYGVCKYYNIPAKVPETENITEVLDSSTNKINEYILNQKLLLHQQEQDSFEVKSPKNSVDNISSPPNSKKNSFINSRNSSIVDLSELEICKSTSNEPHNNLDDDIHFVDRKQDIHKSTTYLSYIRRWFGS